MGKMNNKNVFIYVKGCERRSLDAKKISTYFMKNNYKIVNNPKIADYIIFFTCGFVNTVADDGIKTIKKFKKFDGELIVAGCLPDIADSKLKEVFDGKKIPTKNMDIIDTFFENNEIKFSEIKDENIVWQNFNPIGIYEQPANLVKNILNNSKIMRETYIFLRDNTIGKIFIKKFPFAFLYFPEERYFDNPLMNQIFISRGCIHNCSYCAIKKAVGPLQSKSKKQCMNEFKKGLKEGYKKFLLQADDVGIYGVDIKSSLPELLNEMTEIKGDYMLYLSNTHPYWLIKYADQFETIFKKNKIKYLLLSIQSANSRILKLMRRNYKKEDLINVLNRFKKADSNLKIEVEAIAGFPSETSDEFKDTLEFIKESKIDSGMIYGFSPMNKTDANDIKPQILKREMNKRLKMAKKYLKNLDYSVWYNSLWVNGVFFEKK